MDYNCILEDEINLYINYMRLNNQRYKNSLNVLKSFAECADRKLYRKEIDDAFLNIWIKDVKKKYCGKLPQEFVYAYNSFAEYLCCLDIPALKLDVPKYQRERIERFFNEDEIEYLFKTIDHSINKRVMNFYDVSFSVYTRCIYSLGLRPRECFEITVDDIDKRNNEITVYRTYDGIPRVLPVGETLMKCLVEYAKHFNTGERLFVKNSKESTMNYYEKKWHKVVKSLGIDDDEVKESPLFSLRHSFAIHNLKRAIREDRNIDQFSWMLAVFMGLLNVKSIQNYLKYCDRTITGKINLIMEDYDNEIFDEGL